MYITLTIKECNTIKLLGAVKVLCDMMITNNFCINFYLFYPHNLKNHITHYHILHFIPHGLKEIREQLLYESERGTFMLRVISSLKSIFFFLVQVTPVTSPLIDCNVMTSCVPA